MKSDLPCALIKDILPLYNDAATSAASNEMIKYHMNHCSDCSAYLKKIRESNERLPEKEDETDRYVKIGRKIRKRKMTTAVSVIILFIVTLTFIYTAFCPVLVSGDSMMPTMSDGKMVSFNRLAYTFTAPKRLDVVAYQRSAMMGIGRIIAFPDEAVKITDGTIYVNGVALEYPYIPKSFSLNEFTVKEGEYFIIKDNTDDVNSIPQFVPSNSMLGKFHVKG